MDMGRDMLSGSWKEASGKCFRHWIQRTKEKKKEGLIFCKNRLCCEKGNTDNACPVFEAVWNHNEATGFKREIPKLNFMAFNSSSTLTYATSIYYLLDKAQLMC